MVGEVAEAAHLEQLRMQVIPEIHVHRAGSRLQHQPFVLMVGGVGLGLGAHHQHGNIVARVGECFFGAFKTVCDPVTFRLGVSGLDFAVFREIVSFESERRHRLAGISPFPGEIHNDSAAFCREIAGRDGRERMRLSANGHSRHQREASAFQVIVFAHKIGFVRKYLTHIAKIFTKYGISKCRAAY